MVTYIQIISDKNGNRRTTKRWVNIKHPVVRSLLDPRVFERLMKRHPSGKVHFWANASGKNNVNLFKDVNKIPEGTEIYFQKNGKIKYTARTTMNVFENKAFADLLWGPKEDGQSYRWIFPLGRVHRTPKVSMAKIGTHMAYKKTFRAFRAVTRLQGKKEMDFLNAINTTTN